MCCFRSGALFHPETLHQGLAGVAENLCMVCPCAAIAETEGTCPGDTRRVRIIPAGGNSLIHRFFPACPGRLDRSRHQPDIEWWSDFTVDVK